VSWPAGFSEGTITLPENTESVAVVNRTKLTYMPPLPDATKIYPNRLETSEGLITGFYNEVYNRHFLTYKGTSYQFQDVATDSFLPRLEQSQIQSVSKSADILVSLEMLHQFYEDQYVVEIRKQKAEGDTYREVDYIVGKRKMHLTAGWRVYNTKTGELVDSFVSVEDYTYEAEDVDRPKVTELLDKNLARELRNMGLRLGHAYAAKVSPTKHFTYRNIYDRGSDELEMAAAKVRDDKWEEAAEIWESALETEGNKKRKAMLYHNLAMYKERSGDQEAAKKYAKLAANHHKLGAQTQQQVGF
jgi:hypothetical protein